MTGKGRETIIPINVLYLETDGNTYWAIRILASGKLCWNITSTEYQRLKQILTGAKNIKMKEKRSDITASLDRYEV